MELSLCVPNVEPMLRALRIAKAVSLLFYSLRNGGLNGFECPGAFAISARGRVVGCRQCKLGARAFASRVGYPSFF
jgi:hypothetical protein